MWISYNYCWLVYMRMNKLMCWIYKKKNLAVCYLKVNTWLNKFNMKIESYLVCLTYTWLLNCVYKPFKSICVFLILVDFFGFFFTTYCFSISVIRVINCDNIIASVCFDFIYGVTEIFSTSLLIVKSFNGFICF